MNTSELKYFQEVIQAFLNGKQIECLWKIGKEKNKWEPCLKPTWDCSLYEYRIKPNPLLNPNDYRQVKFKLVGFPKVTVTQQAFKNMQDFYRFHASSHNQDIPIEFAVFI